MKDYVVLVDDRNEVTGTSEKLEMHNSNTLLHRGFSIFLFNKKGKLLLQHRSHKKKTWPLVWSNSCCGHPMMNENPENAAKRRLLYELGINNAEIFMILPEYKYRFKKDGIVENEFCPVMIGFTDEIPTPNPLEVENIKWVSWKDWLSEIRNNAKNYSEWCVEETVLLDQDNTFHKIYDATLR